MQLHIRHETVYRYSAPQSYTIQQLRLTPRPEQHQRTLSWQIATANRCHESPDAFGNIGHILTLVTPHDEVRIVARGVVEVSPLQGGRLLTQETFSPLVFTIPTRMTAVNPALEQFARDKLTEPASMQGMLALAQAICEAVAYQPGATGVSSTAGDALQLGRGVCQDHAHLFLACCHVHGVPARYVSGYIDSGSTGSAESHAWVDVWLNDDGFAGWVSIDVTHAAFADDRLCRLAIGRDYESAAPVRGVRHGSGNESLHVNVEVRAVAAN